MSLFKKIIIPIALIILVLQIIMSILYISERNNSAQKEAQSNMENNITIIERSFEQLIKDYTVLALSLINNKDVIEYLEDPDTLDVSLLDDTLKVLSDAKSASPILNNVFIMPADGFVRINVQEGYNTSSHDLTERLSYQDIIENPFLEAYIATPKAGAVNNRAIFNIFGLSEKNGELFGAIGLPISLHDFVDEIILDAITDKSTDVYIIDNQGNIIGAAEETIIYNEKYNLKTTDMELFQEMSSNKNGDLEYTYRNVDSWVNYGYLEVLDIYIMITKDSSGYKKTQTIMIGSSILISLLILFVVFDIIYVIIKKITTPLDEIVDVSKVVSKSQFDVKLNEDMLGRNDEIGTLSVAFQQMLEHIDKNFIELEKKRGEIEYLAFHDPLTQLSNRRYFRSVLEDIDDGVEKATVLMMDIDNFKLVNDTLGHILGDKVLCHISDLLLNIADDDVIVTRFGGDEFILWIDETTNENRTMSYISELENQMKLPILIGNTKVELSFSIGITKYPNDSSDINMLIRYSDLALYEAKKGGKKGYKYFDFTMEKDMFKKSKVEHVIAETLNNESFHMLYQPQVDLKTGSVVAYEALMRLNDGSYTPGEFIPVAEETGQIIAIGRAVVEKVFKQIAAWRDLGQEIKSVSINYSVKQIQDNDFIGYVLDRLDYYQLKSEWIEFEVTENVFIDHLPEAVKLFKSLKAAGIKISVDDFGTGYSSLTYVINLPISKIKLDRSICISLLTNGQESIMENIIKLAHSIDLEVVAEGIEEVTEVKKLQQLDCDSIQGYYFSKPIPADVVFDKQKYEI